MRPIAYKAEKGVEVQTKKKPQIKNKINQENTTS
jgi:hypothetical protein